eukprot:SAG31_NODE_14759_length_789_cov_0.772464_1_plen_72_part_10
MNVTELRALDPHGAPLQPRRVAASSVHVDARGGAHPPAHAVDGQLGSFCCTRAQGAQWLRVDLGESADISAV